MFSYVKGVLEDVCGEYIVVDVHGIGYKVFTSVSTIQGLPKKGENVKVFTYFYVREDCQTLYGFLTQEELGMFELLISVSGVGPKAALSALSAIAPSKFGLAVITEDVKTLTKIPGIGNKTAQRIILELKDKIKKEQMAVNMGGKLGDYPEGHIAEAISALMVLGYTPAEARAAVSKVAVDDRDVESIIKEALKNLMKG